MRAHEQQLQKKLSAASANATLIRGGLFLTGWELLKSEVIEGVHSFYVSKFNPDPVTSDEYERQVLSLHKRRFEASLMWLERSEALTAEQVQSALRILAHRNEIAHELPRMLIDPSRDVSVVLLEEMSIIVDALGRFWGGIEVETSPDLYDQDIDRSQIKSGSMLLMNHLVTSTNALVAALEQAQESTGT